VAEILALPNPAVWWLGLISVPLVAWLAWTERVKAYLLLIAAYVLQWLPWILSPRIAFEYHFYPNLAIICLADAVLLQRVWNLAKGPSRFEPPRVAVMAFIVLVVVAFAFWYPILAGTPITWNEWNARMWSWLMGQLWINPHPGQ
jgi:dolichyl-phosphate-mannose--protein O-mannosyl transferase